MSSARGSQRKVSTMPVGPREVLWFTHNAIKIVHMNDSWQLACIVSYSLDPTRISRALTFANNTKIQLDVQTSFLKLNVQAEVHVEMTPGV